jgi:hypothetical protein
VLQQIKKKGPAPIVKKKSKSLGHPAEKKNDLELFFVLCKSTSSRICLSTKHKHTTPPFCMMLRRTRSQEPQTRSGVAYGGRAAAADAAAVAVCGRKHARDDSEEPKKQKKKCKVIPPPRALLLLRGAASRGGWSGGGGGGCAGRRQRLRGRGHSGEKLGGEKAPD